jgi:hypothetical protein
MNSTIMAPPPSPVINGPKVGDILVSNWGYDANIASFAKVIAVTGKSVKIVSLGANDSHTGPMEWTSTPDLSRTGPVKTKRFSAAGEGYRVKDSTFANFYLWDGKPVNCYNYH